MLNSMDIKYNEMVSNILSNGYYDNNRTGVPTYKLPHQVMQFNLEKEFPVLQTKRVALKTAIKEMLWIYSGNNSVKDLQAQNVNIWNEWEMEDGTIGTSYGWIVKKYDQLNKLIKAIRTNPQDRRMMINLWQIDYLKTGALYPCCFLSMWDVTDGHLNCMLVQRSADVPLGLPFNTSQYAVFALALAKITGLKPGLLTHVINNAHIYENQIDGMRQQLKNYELLKEMSDSNLSREELKLKYKDVENLDDFLDTLFSEVKVSISNDVKEFSDLTIDKINIEYKSLETIKMPVSV